MKKGKPTKLGVDPSLHIPLTDSEFELEIKFDGDNDHDFDKIPECCFDYYFPK